MDEEQQSAAAEAALENAFGNAPKQPAAAPPAPAPDTAAAPEPTEDGPSLLDLATDELDPDAPAAETPSGPEPEYVIEVDGKQETVRGADQVKELLQKGAHYTKNSQEVAWAREQVIAHARMTQAQAQFNQSAMQDIAELRALDQQLEQYNKIDWATAIDQDLGTAMKWQQQRAVIKEQREQKVAALESKRQQFEKSQAEAAQQLRAAEETALLTKFPHWRNSEKAADEKQALIKTFYDYGYQPAEIANLMDHRALVMARDAMKWRQLQRSTQEQTKRVREAPPVIKPGAATPTQGESKSGFDKFAREFRKQGRAGNHRAQETALEKVFARTFK